VAVAGCAQGPAIVSPSPPAASSSAVADPTRSEARTASPRASASTAGQGSRWLAAELEIGTLAAAETGAVLAFVSDGSSILFSSDLASDAVHGSAPDLWRVGATAGSRPELVWRNPERDHSIVRIDGDGDTIAWAETPVDGTRAWNLWVTEDIGAEPVLIDDHPGDASVSSLVPSFDVRDGTIVWTAFDLGSDGPVSQLLVAERPAWTPFLLAERFAAEAELWLPSLSATHLAYTEVRYSARGQSDDRHVHLLPVESLRDREGESRRLDTSGRATMPLALSDAVVWKETDRGYNMFNWGRMVRYDLATATITPLSTRPQEYVNYPSAGDRYLAWWGADAFAFGVYDLERKAPVTLVRHASESGVSVLRPHIAGDLLGWLEVGTGGARTERTLRYTVMTGPDEGGP